MRAFATMRALQSCTQLRTVVLPLAESLSPPPREEFEYLELPDPQIAAASWLRHSESRSLLKQLKSLPARARVGAPACMDSLTDEDTYDLVYVLRLYLAGAALPLRLRYPGAHFVLDIDEVDARVTRQQAQLLETSGDSEKAARYRGEAQLQDSFAQAAYSWFDTVACASDTEATSLTLESNPVVLPNVIAPPVDDIAKADITDPHLLYLGNLDYQPNRDALGRLVEGILPGLRAVLPGAHLSIAGGGGEAQRLQMEQIPGVNWLGYAEQLPPLYREASVVAVPLQVGGGSRIKILEAFAHGVPVVATTRAVEGLSVKAGVHVLLAETDSEFVAAILQLQTDSTLRSRQVAAARKLVCDHYSPRVLAQRMAALAGKLT